MSRLENLSSIEQLNELGNDAIEALEKVQPIEQNQMVEEVEKPCIEEIVQKRNVSFKGGNCMCSCDLTCTRA